MLGKLTIQNVKRSSKDYLIYLVTMTLVASLMFAFNGMMFSSDMRDLYGEMTVFIAFVGLVSFFIVLIVIWLIHYMVHFMLEKRSKEFGIYLLLGMKKKQIASIFRKENLILGMLALIAGFLPGILFQMAFINIFYSVLDVEYRISIDVSVWNLLLTFGLFLISYLIALIRVKRQFKRMTINKLIDMERQNEKNSNEKRTWKRWLVLLSVVYIILFHVLAFKGRMNIATVWLYLAGFIAAIYLLYIGLSSIFVKYIKRESKGVYQGANIFVFRQLSSKMKTMRFTMGTMTLLFTVALLAWMVVMMFGDWQKKELSGNLLYDVLLFSEDPDDTFDDVLAVIHEDAEIEEVLIYNIYYNGTDTVNQHLYQHVSDAFLNEERNEGTYFGYDTYMGIGEYNTLRMMAGYDQIKLAENQYLIQCKERVRPFLEDLTEGSAISNIITDPFMQNGMNGADYLIVVPDVWLEDMNPYYSMLAVNLASDTPTDLESRLWALRGNDKYEGLHSETIQLGYGSSDLIHVGYHLLVRETNMAEMEFILTSMIFVMAYIGVVFICIALTILAIQQLSDSTKYKFRYRILGQLGMSRRETERVVLQQLSLYYLCPFLISIVLSICMGMFASERFVYYTGISAGIFKYYFLAAGIFAILYLVYFFVTYVSFLRNIHGEMH